MSAAAAGRNLWQRHKWLVLRRVSQLSILALFLAGPWFGAWIVKGNLTSSLTLGTLPLTDPYVLLQTLAAGHWPYRDALIGVAIVIAFYLFVGGRVFCSWVCPVNIVTDAAAWGRRALGIKSGRAPDPRTRHWLLAGTFVAAVATGTAAWEWVNPVSLLHRGLFFGMGLGGLLILGIFLYDLLVASRGWCGRLCPMGAFYGLLGRVALPRISASQRGSCDDCLDCFAVCPEPQVIRPALKGHRGTPGDTPIIVSPDCTLCGRCIDVCDRNVFRLAARFDRRSDL